MYRTVQSGRQGNGGDRPESLATTGSIANRDGRPWHFRASHQPFALPVGIFEKLQ